jgi:hypothetical protein
MRIRYNGFDWFVLLVRVALVAGIVALWLGCTTNAVTFATNPRCLISCKAEPASPVASSIVVEQTIKREGAPHANP